VCEENGRLFHRARLTVTFADREGRTALTIRARLELVPDRNPRWTLDRMGSGWRDGWDSILPLLAGHVRAVAGAGGA